MKIYVNKAMVDYLTVTTEDEETVKQWSLMLSCLAESKFDKIKRYQGERGEGDYSGIFIGESVGRVKKHYIMQVSGVSADGCMEWLDPFDISSGLVNVTRVDVQVTIDQPVDWSQIGYMHLCEGKGLKPYARRSRDPINKKGELITIYTGTRTSGRLNRCYQKVEDDGNLLLRYETEFGRRYAKSVVYGILTGKATRESVVKGEINRRKLSSLMVFDLWQCQIFKPKQEERIAIDKRADWLVKDILPVFAEYINRHGADPRVVDFYLQAIENCEVR